MREPVTELLIDVNKWYRGHGQDESKLLRHDGQRCCIGFLGVACGYDDKQLLMRPSVAQVLYENNNNNTEFLFPNRFDWAQAYEINDSPRLLEKDRRELLKEWFQTKLDINLKFSDEQDGSS